MKPLRTLVAAACLSAGSLAGAVQVTLSGAHFDVVYDDALLGLFGTPLLTGNVLSWFPSGSPGFSAQSAGGIDFTNSTFAVLVTAKPDYELASFGLAEGGDYLFFADGTGTGAGVAVSGQLRVTPLPGSTLTSAITAAGPFVGNALLDFTTQNWTAAASVVAPAGTTQANASVENLLSAFVLPARFGTAFIEKKEVSLTINVRPVPEPTAATLMLAGLAVVGFVALRRRPR